MTKLFLIIFVFLCGCTTRHVVTDVEKAELTSADDLEFGRIKRVTGDIVLAEWNKIIQSDNSLKQVEDRIGQNPFTKEEIIFSGEGKAYFVLSGKD